MARWNKKFGHKPKPFPWNLSELESASWRKYHSKRMLSHWAKRKLTELEKWKRGEIAVTCHKAKSLLKFERGEKCEICGWAETNKFTGTVPVEMDHKDGDCYNHKYENVSLICPNHHSLTSTFSGANKGKGFGRKRWLGK